MKIKLMSVLLISVFVFTSLSVFAADAKPEANLSVSANSNAILFINNFNANQ